MKVYIVYGRESFDDLESNAEVVRVFASKDSAEKFVVQYEPNWYSLFVEETEVEE